MDDAPIKVLLVEDNPGDARLLRETLVEAGAVQFELTHVERLSEALQRLSEQRFAAVLLDLLLPDSMGLNTLVKVCAQAPGVPVVVLTGLADEALAVQSVQAGAQDYLVKGQLSGDLLVRALRYAIERKRAEEGRERLIRELQDALTKVKVLSGLLPICASCKKIRDNTGLWHAIEVYIRDRSSADFSHSVCPECVKKLYPDLIKGKPQP